MSTALYPNGRCRMHGGLTPKGIASPNFIHGRHSIYLPTGIKTKYQNAIQDPKLLELGDEVGLVDALLQERVQKVYSGETEEFWEYVKGLWEQVKDLLDDPLEDEEENAKEFDRVRGLLDSGLARGLQTFKAYETIQPMIEQRRKLTESENKRLKELQASITIQQALGIISLLSHIVKTHITDPKILAAISEDLAKTIDIGGTSIVA